MKSLIVLDTYGTDILVHKQSPRQIYLRLLSVSCPLFFAVYLKVLFAENQPALNNTTSVDLWTTKRLQMKYVILRLWIFVN